MIPDLLMGLFTDGLVFLIGLIPSFSLPSWLGSGGALVDAAASLGVDAQGFGLWIPFDAIGNVLTALAVALPIAIGIALVRMVISNATGGGGAT